MAVYYEEQHSGVAAPMGERIQTMLAFSHSVEVLKDGDHVVLRAWLSAPYDLTAHTKIPPD